MTKTRCYTVIVVLTIALGGFLSGFDSAVISGTEDSLEVYFALNKAQLGWVVSCLIVGCMAGNAVAGVLGDHLGRKRTLLLTAMLFTVSGISAAMAWNFALLVASRILCGVAVGIALLVAPVYIAEISPPKLRGTLVSFNQLNIVIGISAAYFSNYVIDWFFATRMAKNTGHYDWRWMLGVEAVPAVVYFGLLLTAPESPRWLLGQGRADEARRVLARTAGAGQAEEEFDSIRRSFAEKVGGSGLSALLDPGMRFVLFLALAIAFFHQITGINAILYYAPTVFSMAGGGREASLLEAILLGLVNLAMTPLAMALIDRWGRRPLLVVGAAGMAISLLACSWAFSGAHYQLAPQALERLSAADVAPELLADVAATEPRVFATEAEFVAYLNRSFGAERIAPRGKLLCRTGLQITPLRARVVLLGILGFVGSFALSIGPVMWVLLAEIFPNRLRGVAISLVGFWNGLVSFSVTAVFPREMANLGPAITYLAQAAMAVLTLLFVLAFVPETKGRSLEELGIALSKSTPERSV